MRQPLATSFFNSARFGPASIPNRARERLENQPEGPSSDTDTDTDTGTDTDTAATFPLREKQTALTELRVLTI